MTRGIYYNEIVGVSQGLDRVGECLATGNLVVRGWISALFIKANMLGISRARATCVAQARLFSI